MWDLPGLRCAVADQGKAVDLPGYLRPAWCHLSPLDASWWFPDRLSQSQSSRARSASPVRHGLRRPGRWNRWSFQEIQKNECCSTKSVLRSIKTLPAPCHASFPPSALTVLCVLENVVSPQILSAGSLILILAGFYLGWPSHSLFPHSESASRDFQRGRARERMADWWLHGCSFRQMIFARSIPCHVLVGDPRGSPGLTVLSPGVGPWMEATSLILRRKILSLVTKQAWTPTRVART